MRPLLTKAQLERLHSAIISQSGGAEGLRDAKALDSALAQPSQAFAGQLLCPDLIAQAAALGFFLISNHPFLDGNKRIGHAAMEVVLQMHGMEIRASVDEQERRILDVASGCCTRADLEDWLRKVVFERSSPLSG
ncbi:type II toxin-antitoxin system death-on-curing family toxin [Magnetovirga frankeli]|uniref:type II toxin-antitoxin system death-on-curing family toxin n=1 Tax=Magnetovirga frankeli TaxID=947516 RepID=UPI001293791C|nr:type II toxin-antitoxin system death-on-curing family toxin [gamma proteobacterium SS-5]